MTNSIIISKKNKKLIANISIYFKNENSDIVWIHSKLELYRFLQNLDKK